MRRLFRFAAVFALVALVALVAPVTPRAFAATGPAVAVLNFNTQGLTGDWWGNFEPGVAISDLLTDQLVNGGKFNVLDRSHLGSVMQEHNLSTSGEVSPASAISTGQLVGARYLVTGNVLQLDKTGQSGGTAGGIIGGFAGGVIGGVNNSRVTIKVAVHVIDAQTGQIVQAFDDEETKSNLSIGFGGFGGGGFGSYSNSNFENSTMGHLVNDEAAKIAADLDPSKFSSGPALPSLSGRIIAVNGADAILNIGQAKGITVGQYFDVIRSQSIRDPDSGKMLTTNEPIGKIQITSVSGDTSVGHRVSGTIAVKAKVQSE
jgi:curli biogenesis system outer membrane secretion channel CsgG